MHILFLTQILPYPPDAGPRVKTWHVLRYLAGRGHRITLVSYVRPEEQTYLPALLELCWAVDPVPIYRSRPADAFFWLRSLARRQPFLVERDDLPEMRRAVQRVLRQEQIDLIHADQLTMAQFALPQPGALAGAGRRPRTVFDAHNAVWTIVERMRRTAPVYLRPALWLEARRVKAYEGRIIQQFDHTLAVSEQDRQALAAAAGRPAGELPITVIPIAVDTTTLQPAGREPGSRNILTLGTLHYPPNAEGIRWFAREVFPRVQERLPGVTLTIVGRNPPPDFGQLAARPGAAGGPAPITVTGYVPDLDPYMARAGVLVVPVRAGGGMRVRILEALARGMPVVTTTVGLEGIAARPGEDVLVADTPEAFAAAVVQTLESPGLQARLAANGRRLAVERYDWQAVLKQVEEVYLQDNGNEVGDAA